MPHPHTSDWTEGCTFNAPLTNKPCLKFSGDFNLQCLGQITIRYIWTWYRNWRWRRYRYGLNGSRRGRQGGRWMDGFWHTFYVCVSFCLIISWMTKIDQLLPHHHHHHRHHLAHHGHAHTIDFAKVKSPVPKFSIIFNDDYSWLRLSVLKKWRKCSATFSNPVLRRLKNNERLPWIRTKPPIWRCKQSAWLYQPQTCKWQPPFRVNILNFKVHHFDSESKYSSSWNWVHQDTFLPMYYDIIFGQLLVLVA